MKSTIFFAFLFTLSLFLFLGCQTNPPVSFPNQGNSGLTTSSEPINVRIIYTNNTYRLYRGDNVYPIFGAGGLAHLDLLTNFGGNSVRTWGLNTAQSDLDTASTYGLTVALGMWVMPERQGFDYDDPIAVASQFTNFRNAVLQFRNHPALLIWGIGNELNYGLTNNKVWKAVQDIAHMIHQLDTNHPTMTVISGPDLQSVMEIMSNAPDIDILGVNSYKNISGVRGSLNTVGWTKPYIITEWGPDGYWEVSTTTWGAPFEQDGERKAKAYLNRYTNSIAPNHDRCLGSYVFYWNQKQERTPTWFSMFLENIPALGLNGESTETVDVMKYCWTGQWPDNRAPRVSAVKINDLYYFQNVTLPAGSTNSAVVTVTDSENDPLSYVWETLKETTATSGGGDAETRPETVNNLITHNNGSNIIFVAPSVAGYYRLFIYVLDGNGHAGTANIPYQVQ